MTKKQPHHRAKVHERKRLLAAIRAHEGNLNAVARRLRVCRQTVYRWMREDGLEEEWLRIKGWEL